MYVLLAYAIWIIYGLIAFLLDANLSATNPPAIPHWWKRQPLIPNLLSQELKNFLKLMLKRKCSDCRPGDYWWKCRWGCYRREYPYLPRCRYSGSGSDWANCLIGNFAFIRPGTIISNGVKLVLPPKLKCGYWSEATIGPQCFIADSVVANQAYLGAQVRTSNHRLDEHPCLFELQMELSLPDAIN